MPKAAPKDIEFIARGLATNRSRLLVCRNRKHGYCYLPGGHIDPGERAAEALAREFLEETGLTIAVGPFLLASENIFAQRNKPKHEFTALFHVEHADGPWPDPVPSLEDKLAFEWIELAALPESGLLPPTTLAWLMAGGPDQPTNSHEATWISDRQND
ncbi:hypothetical protein MNBD_PLANCTO03-256 [hydrothermal vent metagenome]|uniref:Nudix hydrolase domain-containing protein n=1 Tax=hydrothermal vent metagenome TaxID=652676 RepID=A0A3B1DD38_9ZZZZ